MVYKFFAMNEKDKSMTDAARLHKVTLQNGDIQQFVYRWDETLSLMTKQPDDDDLMNLFVLQFDVHLPKNHEFYVEYLFWYNQPAGSPNRNYEGLWKLVHDWVRRKKDAKNRRESLKDHLPGLTFDKAPKGKGKGKGKDKNGEPQVCFAWRNNGVCTKNEDGDCVYAHPPSAKNTGKPKGGGKDGKQKRSSSTSSRGGKGNSGGGKGPGSPRGKVVTDPKLLCQKYLKGTCDKGKACKYHHNGPCIFHKKGNCNRGADCVYSHHDVKPAASAIVEPSPKSAAAKKKAQGKADENA